MKLNWSELYANSIQAGTNYGKLKKCIMINIVNFECIGAQTFHSVFKLLERDEHILLNDDLEIHFIELTTCDDNKPVEEMTHLEQWTIFLKDYNDEKKQKLIERIASKKEAIKMAADYLDKTAQDEVVRERLRAIERYQQDQNSREQEAFEDGIEEGMEKGIEKGIEEGKMAMVINGLKKGLDIEILSELSGLSICEINKIKKQYQ